MSVRAKFFVSKVDPHDNGLASTLIMFPVCRGVENREWASATPGGSLTMVIRNDAATAQFVVGQEYYLTFERANRPEPGDGHEADPTWLEPHRHADGSPVMVCDYCGGYPVRSENGLWTWAVHDDLYRAR